MAAAGLPRTAAALRRLGSLLRCSRCQELLNKPVGLGCCEHVFCLACVGGCTDVACPMCRVPITVQDVKVNRQLDNIARLYRKLQALQDVGFSASGAVTSSPWEGVANRGKKRQIKMWFSPRSRKMRFQHLKKEPEKPGEAAANQESRPSAPRSTSVYDFRSLSPEPVKEAEKPPKCKKRLREPT